MGKKAENTEIPKGKIECITDCRIDFRIHNILVREEKTKKPNKLYDTAATDINWMTDVRTSSSLSRFYILDI